MPAKASLKVTLTLDYKIPSLNEVMGTHWIRYYNEKKKASLALMCALQPSRLDPETATTLEAVARLYSTRSKTSI